MNDIINNIFLNENIKKQFIGYKLIDVSNFNNIPKGSHIKYITLNEEVKNAGTFIKAEFNNSWSKSYLLIKAKNTWKLKFQKNFIFYKESFSFRDLMNKIANNQINIKIVKK